MYDMHVYVYVCAHMSMYACMYVRNVFIYCRACAHAYYVSVYHTCMCLRMCVCVCVCVSQRCEGRVDWSDYAEDLANLTHVANEHGTVH